LPGTQVKAAIASYLQSGMAANGGPIPLLNAVISNPPRFVGEFVAYSGQGPGANSSGAIIWLSLGAQGARQITEQGQPAGGKMYWYEMKLQCVLLSTRRKTEDAANDNDLFVDGLCEWIDHDKNAGTGYPNGLIFQWGQGRYPSGGDDILFERGWPKPRKQGPSHVYTKGTVIANEWHANY
jgi:hypothetical protein